ncbi:MAG TPA: hypothetical protein VM100_08950 [Longimicrobiales bacterium]|nr:hypothetical protein [Longimicrobiales bacterium]
MSLLDELQKRKVITTTLIYLGITLVVIVFVELIAGIAEMRQGVVDTVAIMMFGATPLVVALAWMFDITTAGVEHTSSRKTKVTWKKVGLPLIAGALLIFISLAFYSLSRMEKQLTPAPHQSSNP